MPDESTSTRLLIRRRPDMLVTVGIAAFMCLACAAIQTPRFMDRSMRPYLPPTMHMNPRDILAWPDGFWCFREEFDKEFLRDDTYRVLAFESEEWLLCSQLSLWRFGSSDN